MQNQFSRSQLLFGQEAIAHLGTTRVAVFGVGGVGSYAAEALVRGGVGAVDLVDDDTVCVTNINRQIIALHSTVGKNKVEVMRDRLLDINPHVQVTLHQCFVGTDNIGNFDFTAYDYVLDAVDTVTAKLALVEACHAADIPIISAMGAGNKLDPTRFQVADIYSTSVCPLARVMRQELRKRDIPALKVVYSREEARAPQEIPGASCKNGGCVCPPGSTRHCEARRQIPGSASFVPAVAGLIMAGEAIKDLTGTR